MKHQKLIDELNYHRAQKTTEKLYKLGLITVVEYDKLQAINQEKFSPLLADLFPKTVDISSNKS